MVFVFFLYVITRMLKYITVYFYRTNQFGHGYTAPVGTGTDYLVLPDAKHTPRQGGPLFTRTKKTTKARSM
jgi:hypothetical protein